MKFLNLHIVWTAGKNLALPDTISGKTPPELLKGKEQSKYHKQSSFSLQKMKLHQDYSSNMQQKLT